MAERIENRNLRGIESLVSPGAVVAALPLSERAAATVRAARRAVRDVIHGVDSQRRIIIVGPCSIHDPDAALEYAERLVRVAAPLREHLVVVMRTYFEKPRTTIGWKGLVNDPHLDGSCDVEGGLAMARGLLLAINERGLPCGSEMLDPFTPQFLADLLSWASLGARTTESQTHRELASGLSMPVGFKNGTDGDLTGARNAMVAARHPHSFLGIDANGSAAVVRTAGNPDRHLILRGGRSGPNFSAEAVARAAAVVAGEKLARPVLVDCSHDNAGRDHTRQGAVCREVASQMRTGTGGVLGVMLESNLRPGQQEFRPGARLRRGVEAA